MGAAMSYSYDASKLPAPGIYRLTRTVVNPMGDKRVKNEFAREPLWQAGRRVLIRPDDLGFSDTKCERLKISAMGGYAHQGFFLDVVPSHRDDPDYTKIVQRSEALLEPGLLELEPPSIESVLTLQHWENWNSPLLQQLVDSGKITLDDVNEAIKQYLARPE